MKVFITGANGQLGRELQLRCPAGIDLVTSDQAELDVTDESSVASRLREARPDVVISAAAYTAVVLINTAMGWTADPAVEKFLDRFGEMDSIIVLTTSDGGDVLPDLTNRRVDAISSASVKERVPSSAEAIVEKINRLTEDQR